MPPILYFALVGLSLIWGASFFFIKVLLASFNPFAIVFFRSFFGAIIVFIVMLITKKQLIPKKAPWLMIFAVALTNSVLPWSLIGFSETSLSSSMASILNATTPIWTLLVGITLFKTKTNSLQWLGILLGFIGIFILIDVDFSQLAINNLYGFFGMMLTTLFYGISAQLSKRYFNELSSFQISFLTLSISSLITGTLTGFTNSFHLNLFIEKPTILLAFIGLGSFGSGIAYLIYYFIIQKGSAEFASLVTYLVPVSALFWGFMILHEEIKPTMLIGLALILFGVYISGRKKKEAAIKKAKETTQGSI